MLRRLLRVNKIRFSFFRWSAELKFYREIAAYDAETPDGRVFVREEGHRFLPYQRRTVYSPPDVSKDGNP